jgi:hypothetical protein
LLDARARAAHRSGASELAQGFRQAAAELWDGELPDPLVSRPIGDVDARAVLEGVVDAGLLRPPLSAGEKDELAERDAEIARLKTRRVHRGRSLSTPKTRIPPPVVVAVPLRPHEAQLIQRAVEELVKREGESWTAANVRQLLERPLELDELARL